MAQSNKILTVSYGTFSCTLEGFDNPFAAMQSIAQYFRDLAAEDRYFGAEPPQPDAQMLHQIAEREVSRRVEARVGDRGVALRQMTETDDDGSAPDAPAPTKTAPQTTEDPTDAETSTPESETVAERLARIRAASSSARAGRKRPQVEEDQEEPLLTAFAVAEDAEVAEQNDRGAVAMAPVENEPSLSATRAPEDQKDTPDDASGSSEREQPADAEPLALSLISAAQQVGVARGVATIANGLTTGAAQRAEADLRLTEASEANEFSGTAAEHRPISPVVIGGAASGMGRAAAENAPTSGARPLPRTNEAKEARASGGADDGADTDARDGTTGAANDDAEFAKLLAAVASSERGPGSKADGSCDDPDQQEPGQSSEATEESKDWVDVELEDDNGIPGIVRMSRAEFEKALEDGDLEEIDEDMPTLDSESTIREILADTTSLDDVDASTLAAELAAVERSGNDSAGGQTAPKASDEDRAVGPIEALSSEKSDRGSDVAVSRLIDETNTHMGEPEAHRRRTAIQHLRAAVAATRADGRLRDQSPTKDASVRKFREDLQKAVRPRRPEVTGRLEEPATSLAGPGPLMLASSQRVDSRVEHVRPVRPLRDKAASGEAVDTDDPHESKAFSDFAAKLGARDLPDLLEAAAAYSKIVEGQDGASRPMLIRRATEAAPDGSTTREDGLKSFGQLLRSGRIRKIEPGRFALAEDAEIVKKAGTAQ